jgi:murein DD-endopeptidase MepM/ murein hydrolase activator NlpD
MVRESAREKSVRGALCVLVVAALLDTAVHAADALQITTAARAIQPGEVVVVSVRSAEPLDSLHVRAFGAEFDGFRVDRLLWQVLLGIDLGTAPGPHAMVFEGVAAGRAVKTTSTLLVKAHAFPTRVLRVDDAFVNPPAEVLKRIEAEAAELAHLWTASAPDRLWHDGFRAPVPGASNGAFGTRSIFNGQPRQPHSGADFRSPAGTLIVAPADGRVVLSRALYFTGNTVVVDHGLGLLSLFAHLSTVNVGNGDMVAAGSLIGRVGATGRVTGPHLHWAIRLGGARVDPLSVLALLPPSRAREIPPADAITAK